MPSTPIAPSWLRPLLAIVLSLTLSLPALAAPARVTDFGAIMAALTSGERVRVLLHYKLCRLIADNEVKEKVPDAVLIAHPTEGYVVNHVKLRIEDGGRVRVVARYLDPTTHEVKMDEAFETTIDPGDDTTGARFFVSGR